MALTNKIENRVLMISTAVVTILATVLIMTFGVVKPLKKVYEVQLRKQNELIIELAKISKYSIQNTYTIKKPKKGSTLIIAPDNDMTVNEVTKDLDEKINNLLPVEEDTIKTRKTFWDKIKFWD